MTESLQVLSRTTRFLHFIIAFGMIGMLALGIYMEEFEVHDLYDLHKSIGAIILILALVRVLWRMKKGWPSALGNMSKLQHFIAKAVHWLLIIATVLYPVSGIMMSVGGGHGLAVFGLEIAAEQVNAAGEAIPVNEAVAGIGHNLHGLMTYIVITVIVLHIVGALKHHLVDKDNTISRMFSFK